MPDDVPKVAMPTSGLIGSIGEFQAKIESFQQWLERLEIFFQVNIIEETRKAAVLLSLIGPTNYSILRNLVQPVLPASLEYAELIAKLKAHFSPVPIVIMERYKFHSRSQKTGETITAFLDEIQRLSHTCEFGEFLTQALRDRFVCGLTNTAMQKRLLTISDLTLKSAIETARAMETADSDLKMMQDGASSSTTTAFRVFRTGNEGCSASRHQSKGSVQVTHRPSRCGRCARNHGLDSCKFLDSTCFKCGLVGHIAPACRTKGRKPYKPSQAASTNYVRSKDLEASEGTASIISNCSKLYKVSEYKTPSTSVKDKFQIEVLIANTRLSMLLDTAADLSTVGSVWLNQNVPNATIRRSNVTLYSYTGDIVPTLGTVIVPVEYQNKKYSLNLVVVKGDHPALLGRDWISELRVDWGKIFVLNHEPGNISDLEKSIRTEFADVFAKPSGPIKGERISIQLKADATPVFCKFRTVPFSLRADVEAQINAHIRDGTWIPVEHSKWATPIVIVPKKQGTGKEGAGVRLCGDYKCTVNKMLDITQYPLPSQLDMFSGLSGAKFFSLFDCVSAYEQLELDQASSEVLTLNTHLGLMRPTRLMFGVASAAALSRKK